MDFTLIKVPVICAMPHALHAMMVIIVISVLSKLSNQLIKNVSFNVPMDSMRILYLKLVYSVKALVPLVALVITINVSHAKQGFNFIIICVHRLALSAHLLIQAVVKFVNKDVLHAVMQIIALLAQLDTSITVNVFLNAMMDIMGTPETRAVVLVM